MTQRSVEAAAQPFSDARQTEPVIVTHDLVKRYGSTVALAGLLSLIHI